MIQNESSKVLVYPDSLTREQVVLLYCRLQKEVSLLKTCHSDATASIKQVAYQIRESVKQNCVTKEWPPDSSRLNIDHIDVPPEIDTFLQHLFSVDCSGLKDRMTCLANSIAQDIMF